MHRKIRAWFNRKRQTVAMILNLVLYFSFGSFLSTCGISLQVHPWKVLIGLFIVISIEITSELRNKEC